jgi:hypothetical protein
MLRLRSADCNAGYVKMARILRGVGSSHGARGTIPQSLLISADKVIE